MHFVEARAPTSPRTPSSNAGGPVMSWDHSTFRLCQYWQPGVGILQWWAAQWGLACSLDLWIIGFLKIWCDTHTHAQWCMMGSDTCHAWRMRAEIWWRVRRWHRRCLVQTPVFSSLHHWYQSSVIFGWTPKRLSVPVTFLELSMVLNSSISRHFLSSSPSKKRNDKLLYFVSCWLIKTDSENPIKVKAAFRKISTCDSCPVPFLITLITEYHFSLSCTE